MSHRVIHNFLQIVSVFSCSLVFSYAVISCHSTEKKEVDPSEQQESLHATQVIDLRKGKLSSSLQIPGELIPYQQVDIYAKENSFVKKVFVDVGTEVKQGQLIVSMEAPEINSRLSEAQSNLQSLQAIYISSKANYNRLLETSKTPGTISPNDLDQALARVNSDKARLEGAQAAHRAVGA